jgi:hypothetical protein
MREKTREKTTAAICPENIPKTVRPFSNILVYRGEKTIICFVNPVDKETNNEKYER